MRFHTVQLPDRSLQWHHMNKQDAVGNHVYGFLFVVGVMKRITFQSNFNLHNQKENQKLSHFVERIIAIQSGTVIVLILKLICITWVWFSSLILS